MTAKELYDWAVKNHCEDCEILVDHWSGEYLLAGPSLEKEILSGNNEIHLDIIECYYENPDSDNTYVDF